MPRACSGPGVREEHPQGADIAKDTPDHVLPAGSRRRHRVSTSSRFPRGLLTKAEMPRDAFPRDEGATDTRGECARTRREAGLSLQGPGARGPPPTSSRLRGTFDMNVAGVAEGQVTNAAH